MQEHFFLLKRMQKNARTLRSFEKNGFPTLAIRSGPSEEMSDVSELLISQTKNEGMSDSLKKIWLKKSKILFYYVLS